MSKDGAGGIPMPVNVDNYSYLFLSLFINDKILMFSRAVKNCQKTNPCNRWRQHRL